MYTISKEYHFCAAHRLEGHVKCGRLHGHNYKVIVTVQTNDLIDGMVIDYHDLDDIVNPKVDGMDHKYLVSRENYAANCPYAMVAAKAGHAYQLPQNKSTAEYIAEHLYKMLIQSLHPEAFKVTVEVQETPKVTAVYTA